MTPRVLIVDDNVELLGLLATVFENAGYVVLRAQRGRQALEKAKAERPDFAVVDVLLPDVMGYEVAALLRSLQIPFVMMTGVFKGGKHGLDAVQRHGAIDYFEKPFQVERLIERVSAILPPTGPRASADEHSADDFELDIDFDEDDDGLGFDLTGRVSVVEAGKIAATLKGERIQLPSTPPGARSSSASVLQSPPLRPPPPPPPSSPPPSRASGASPPAAGTPAPAGDSTRSGPLQDNLPQLINAFYQAQETGELVLQRGAVRKTVYFEKGAPVFAVSNLSSDQFGQFLVRIGKVPADELKVGRTVAQRTNRRTGDVLIEMGLINETERMYYVGQQVKAIIYSLFAWETGTWQLTFRKRARQESLKLDVHPANLILRGVRKLYAPARLARLMPDDAQPVPSQDPAYLLSDVELEAWEGSLLARIDGSRSMTELVEIARKPPAQVRGLLVGLLSLRIIETPR